MLNKIIYKKQAVISVILVIAAILILTVWPLKLYQRDHDFRGQNITQISDTVDNENDAGEYFTAQYSHIRNMEVYIDSVEEGDTFLFQLFDQSSGENVLLAREQLIFRMDQIPGYVTIPVNVDVVPGNTYVYILAGHDSKFKVGFESAEDALDNPESPIYNVAFYHDTAISGLALSTGINYRVPLSVSASIKLIGAIALLAALCAAAANAFFGKYPQKNGCVSVISVIRYTLTPVILITGAVFMVMIAPLHMYDSRLIDVIVYETGILLAMLFLLYGLWHDRRGLSPFIKEGEGPVAVRRAVLSILIALVFKYSVDYMNATNDYIHHDSQHAIVILVCIMSLVMAQFSDVFSLPVLITAAVSTVAGVVYYYENRLAPDVREFAEQNANMASNAASYIFIAIAAAAVIVSIVKAVRREERISKPVLWLLIPAALFYSLSVVFRNTRSWLLIMAVLWLVFYVRFAFYNDKKGWIQTLCTGIILNFFCSVIWSMLFRYYLSYNYIRFSLQFHTVTVTAYYLLITGSAALTLFLFKLKEIRGMGIREGFGYIWKETAVLGSVCSYMLMSLTRTGIFSLAIIVFGSCILIYVGEKKAVTGIIKSIAAIAIVTVISFPVIFTCQRIISTTVGRPFQYKPVENYDSQTERETRWNSTDFICVELFIRDFGDRIIGNGVGSKLYYRMEWNVPQVYGGIAVNESDQPMIAAVSDNVIGNITTGSYTAADYSNGRKEIWKEYLSQLNMTGHEQMGITLSDGSSALHAHNILIQMAYDCGIPVGILFAVYLVLTLFATCIYYKRNRFSKTALMPLICMTGFMITGMVEWIFQLCNPYTITLMFIFAALLFMGDAENDRSAA